MAVPRKRYNVQVRTIDGDPLIDETIPGILAHDPLDAIGKAKKVYAHPHLLDKVRFYAFLAPTRRGGPRPGAGAPKTGRKETKVVRLDAVEANVLPYYRELDALLHDWELMAKDADATSPRWEQARRLLADFRELADRHDRVPF